MTSFSAKQGEGIFLTEDEVQSLTHRKRRNSQALALNVMGITHKKRPDGSLAVLRSHIEKTLDGAPEKSRVKEWQPDWSSVRATPPQSRE